MSMKSKCLYSLGFMKCKINNSFFIKKIKIWYAYVVLSVSNAIASFYVRINNRECNINCT